MRRNWKEGSWNDGRDEEGKKENTGETERG
jgi:hypothetical protein